MKFLTINTHSLLEKDSELKMNILADAILEELPDVVAMQEVNQTKNAQIVKSHSMITDDIVRSDNYALQIINALKVSGKNYFSSWLAIKNGYDKFDEGTALLSRTPIESTMSFTISDKDDYADWKTRRILGIKTLGQWFFSVHTGWWHDEDSFSSQWERLKSHLPTGKVWLMGDFNNSANVEGEGYDLVKNSGWYDTFTLAKEKGKGFTIESEIDGWRGSGIKKARIDYIFSNFKCNVKSSAVIFDEENRPRISDHYGVIIETER